DGEASQGEHRELDQRLLQVGRRRAGDRRRRPARRAEGREPVQARAVEDLPIGLERVCVAEHEDDEAAHEEGEDRGQDRHHNAAGPLPDLEARGQTKRLVGADLVFVDRRSRRNLAHAAASPGTWPPVIAIPSVSSLTVGGYSPTILPSYMT